MQERWRHIIQAVSALAMNANLAGFLKGQIWRGASKRFCVPGLNCYSCPGALGSCPIGSLQAVLSGGSTGFSYYVTGTILLFGAVFGRLICGFLCPFGFVQDLLFKLRIRKLRPPARVDRSLRWLKYFILLTFVILLPMVAKGTLAVGLPWFCKYICPAGTLEGGIPLLLAKQSLRAAVGALFAWKMAILVLILIASVLIYRPFCKYICPLGAIYGLLNRWSFYSMSVDAGSCTHCGACHRVCKMQVNVTEDINSAECIRCGACKTVCPSGAISSGFCRRKSSAPAKKKQY